MSFNYAMQIIEIKLHKSSEFISRLFIITCSYNGSEEPYMPYLFHDVAGIKK